MRDQDPSVLNPPDARQFGFYPDVVRHFARRSQELAHDEEFGAWLGENRRHLEQLARAKEDASLDAQDFAPAMADLAGYMRKHENLEEIRQLFVRAAGKLYPEIAELTMQTTPTATFGTLEQVVSLLESGEYQELADRLNVEMIHLRRRSAAELPAAIAAWEHIIVRTLDGDAFMAFKEERHGQIDADVAAEVRRQLSFGIEAVFFLERLREALAASTEAVKAAPEVSKETIDALRREASHAIGFLGSRLTRHVNISALRLEDDIARWQRLADGMKALTKEYMHDGDAVRKKKEYSAKIDALLAELRPGERR